MRIPEKLVGALEHELIFSIYIYNYIYIYNVTPGLINPWGV